MQLLSVRQLLQYFLSLKIKIFILNKINVETEVHDAQATIALAFPEHYTPTATVMLLL